MCRALYPRVRGADHRLLGDPDGPGTSTPACAGLTTVVAACRPLSCLYPRVRGADDPVPGEAEALTPLPPRARG